VDRKICPGCGTGVDCGRAPGKERCWCAEFPPILPVPEVGTGCYCPTCLERVIREKQASMPEAP
jgi:hypothetical protein